jgi:hypothetical protein
MGVMTGSAGDNAVWQGKINTPFGGLGIEFLLHVVRHGYQVITPGGMVVSLSGMATYTNPGLIIFKWDVCQRVFLFRIWCGLMTEKAGIFFKRACFIILAMGILFLIIICPMTGKTEIIAGHGIWLADKLGVDQLFRRIFRHLVKDIVAGQTGDLSLEKRPP